MTLSIKQKAVQTISLNRINLDDKTYSFRLKNPNVIDQIRAEIEQMGQLHPVTLEQINKKEYRILDGFQRCKGIYKLQRKDDDNKIVQAYVFPASDLNEQDRFMLIRNNNFFGKYAFGVCEKARFIQTFYRKGIPLVQLAFNLNLHVHEVEDFLELKDIPKVLLHSFNHAQADPRFLAVLYYRYKGWLESPYKDEANLITQRLLKLFKKEPMTMKRWRFYLDFYWNSNRPSTFFNTI